MFWVLPLNMKGGNSMQKRFLFIVVIFPILLTTSCRAKSPQPLINGIGTYYHFQARTPSQQTVSIHAVTLNSGRYQARLLTLNQMSTHQSIQDIAAKKQAFLAINGSFFTPEFEPLGLYIYKGKQESRFIVNRLLTSLVFIDQQGKLTLHTSLIRSTSPKPISAHYAFQCGPTLIRRGLISVYNNSQRAAQRTILAQARDDKLVVMVTSPVSLYDLAFIMQNNPQWFGVDKFIRVVNLDGGTSTAMSLHSGKAHFVLQNL